jgi:membrane protein
VFDPPEHLLHRPSGLLLRLLRYPYALLRDLMQGHLNLRAMSLVYTTLLSIAPLLALSFSVLKGLGYDRDLEVVVYTFLEPLGDKASELTERLMGFVNSAQSGVLGSLGFAFLLYYVISTIQKVEESFNFVWRVERPRSWARRFSEYLSVMIIGPVVVVTVLGAIAAVTSSRTVQAIVHMHALGPLIVEAGRIVPYVAMSGVFTFLYTFVPNTRVRFFPALVGGAFAGVFWAASGVLFARFVATSSQTILIYAGFAIVIVALVWVYWSWLILLVGVQLSFYVQHPECLRPGRGELHLTAGLRERLALSVMYLIAREFTYPGRRWTVHSLSEQLDLPGAALSEILNALESQNLLARTEKEELIPGRDPGSISLAEILTAVRTDGLNPRVPKVRAAGPAEDIARMADEALKQSVQGKTLHDLVQ